VIGDTRMAHIEDILDINQWSELMPPLDPSVADTFVTRPARYLLAHGEITVQSSIVLDHLWSDESYSNGENLFAFLRGADRSTMEFTQRLQIVLENTDLFGRNFDTHGFRNIGSFFIFY
jgi:hypothetical protein